MRRKGSKTTVRRSLPIAALLLGRFLDLSWAQVVPSGPEFQINTHTTSSQIGTSGRAVAADAAGDFVVVWRSYLQDESKFGVVGQRYASTGTRLGGEFLVNTYTTFDQTVPAVAADPVGNFVVVWQTVADGSGYGVAGQRYASTGAPLGGEFLVNTYTTLGQYLPALATDTPGNFVVVWQSVADGSGYGVAGQRYASTGAPLGGEFLVNTHTTSAQTRPAVAADPAGNFVAVWQSVGQDGADEGIVGQRFASTGAPFGGEFAVNTFTTSRQYLLPWLPTGRASWWCGLAIGRTASIALRPSASTSTAPAFPRAVSSR